MDNFLADFVLTFDNCRLYNPEGSVYYKNANKLEKKVRDLVKKVDIEESNILSAVPYP